MTFLSIEISDLPLCLGAMSEPKNPSGLPSTTPFRLELNERIGRLEQATDGALEALLEQGYELGIEMGTPSDNTDLGKPYVDDFLRFIKDSGCQPGSLLEIGAGTGFLSKCLSEAGWAVTSLEPGKGYQEQWDRHGVVVINDFFPSQKIKGKFDAVVFYTVLEHIKDTKAFLIDVRSHLKPGGRVFLSVPDCTDEIAICDPSILLHEHYQYFTEESLANTLGEAGFRAQVEVGRFGRSLYSRASLHEVAIEPKVSVDNISRLEGYMSGVLEVRDTLDLKVKSWLEQGNVGIFCPSRLINCISPDENLVFYDDAIGIQGRYYPPFTVPVFGRAALIADPPKTLLIGSRTFGVKIKADLIAAGLISDIVLLSELV
jgi:2-polyprenyl-3-methyl-5-hydroxy-6-metoxy-1,4-benzoquinol methylase